MSMVEARFAQQTHKFATALTLGRQHTQTDNDELSGEVGKVAGQKATMPLAAKALPPTTADIPDAA